MIHERFIHGLGESGRDYIVHTRRPRFVAELFDPDDAPASGLSMSIDDEILANFDWIDDPADTDMHKLLADIRDFLAEYDFRAEREIDGAEDDD